MKKMMAINAPSAVASSGCCCSKCHGECCELDCLVEPRFFCGQMLSDQDLTVLLDWVKGKTGLVRYRHGWGVVCGLTVHCAFMSGNDATVGVSTGYAVDCCGNDIIICSDATVDLSLCCPRQQDPCASISPPTPAEPGVVSYFGWPISKGDVKAVDLLIRYKETLSDPRAGLATGGCSGTSACEYTRTLEDYELYCEPANDCEDPWRQRAGDWGKGYYEGRDRLLKDLARFEEAGDDYRTVQQLLNWISQNPLHTFCFVRDWLCDLQRSREFPDNWFAQIAFLIVQDWRIAYLQCMCEGCGPETSVRLARVWLWRQLDGHGNDHWKVTYIDAQPPFRRLISKDCWPVLLDAVSVAPFIWQPRDTVGPPLRQLGFTNIAFERFEPTSLLAISEFLSHEELTVNVSLVESIGTLTAHYLEDHCGRSRIVAFTVGKGGQKRGGALRK